jgi:hypothetical protein
LDSHPGDPEIVRALLDVDVDVDERVRVAAAATLAAWGYADELPLLVRAIREMLVPPNLVIVSGNTTYRSPGTWSRVTDVIRRFGVADVAKLLYGDLQAPQTSIMQGASASGGLEELGPNNDSWVEVALEKIAVLGRLDSALALKALRPMLDPSLMGRFDVGYSNSSVWTALANCTTEATAQDVLDLVLECWREPYLRLWGLEEVLSRVSAVAGPDLIPKLFAVAEIRGASDLEPAALTAVYEISRRHRVRVFAGPRIVAEKPSQGPHGDGS